MKRHVGLSLLAGLAFLGLGNGTATAIIHEYVEDFSTTRYFDAANSTALWDTVVRRISMPPITVTSMGSYDTPDRAAGVTLVGHYAYVADRSSGLQIIDVSEPGDPTRIGFLDTPGDALGVAVEGVYAYIADGPAGLRIINVSNPVSPFSVGAYDTPGVPYGLAVSGAYVYLADSGLLVIDVSNPANPAPIGSADTPGEPYQVAIAGSYAYVADGSGGLGVYDVANPSVPVRVGGAPTADYSIDITVVGDLAFLADGGAGIRVFDVSVPSDPQLLASYDTPGSAGKVEVLGDYVFVADGLDGLLVLDISALPMIRLAGSHDTPGFALDVTCDGIYAYVADQTSGLRITDVFSEWLASPGVITSTIIDESNQTIEEVRLTTSQAGSVSSEVSADGGATWLDLLPDGNWNALAANGSDLLWRSHHTYLGDGRNPACTSLQLEWLARSILVRSDGTGDYPTIQDAIDAAAHSDTVSLSDGVFIGAGNRNIVIQGKVITLRSESGDPTSCIIDCQDIAPGIMIFDPVVPPNCAGKLLSPADKAPFDATFEDSTLSDAGGTDRHALLGTYTRELAQPWLYNQQYNYSRRRDSEIALRRELVTSDVDTITIANIQIRNGHASNFGGGIFLCTVVSAPVVLRGNIVRDCICGDDGGGVCIRYAASATLDRNIITHNLAEQEGSWGADAGGVELYWVEEAYVVRNIIALNTCHHKTGGIWIKNCGATYFASNTVAYNVSDECSQFRVNGESIAEMSLDGQRSIIWTDVSPESAVCVGGVVDAVFAGCDLPILVPGNISEDPLFCGASAGDVTLNVDSPCAPENNEFGVLIGALGTGCGVRPEWVEVPDVPGGVLNVHGAGVSWADYEEDGDDDIYVVNYANPNVLLRNDGGDAFTDVTTGPLGDAGNGQGNAWGDYDNDGDLDLYIGNNLQPNRLLRNDGGGQFSDVTSGPLGGANDGEAAGWGDYDNDGDLDLFQVTYANASNRMLRNDGDGAFTDVTAAPLNAVAQWRDMEWVDYDVDGDVDVYVASHNGGNRLFRNDGGSFVDVTSGPLGYVGPCRSACWGDYDNDGDPDVYLANYGAANVLLRNDGVGAFTDVTAGPLGDDGQSYAATWGDYDNDGWLDLFLTRYDGQGNRLLRNQGDGSFADVAELPLTGPGTAVGPAWGDYDGDGDLELFVSYDTDQSRLFRNDLAAGAHWLEIDLVGTQANRSGVGALITVTAGEALFRRQVGLGSGFLCQNSLTAHFGLGDATTIDEVEVRWPSGVIQTVDPPAVDQRITVTEPHYPLVSMVAPLPPMSGPIGCDQSVLLAFHYTPAYDAPAVRGYSIRVQATSALSFTAGDITVNSLPLGEQTFHQIIPNGPSDFTIDYTILGTTTQGITDEADLFTVLVHGGVDGTGTVSIPRAQLRDLQNQPIEIEFSATATVVVDCSPPGPVTGITAIPGHQRVTVNWIDPGDADLTAVEIWRGLWHDPSGASVYPEYDDVPNVIPTRPVSRAEAVASAEWTLAGTVDPGVGAFTDVVAPRGVYYYEVFARDDVNSYGPPATGNARATNYWLGDFTYDGYVDVADLTFLGAVYGIPAGGGGYNAEVDVGPTSDASGHGIPLTDSVIDFEDLIIVGLNFGEAQLRVPISIAGPARLAWMRLDERTWSLSLLEPSAGLMGLHVTARLPVGVGAELSEGSLLGQQAAPVFLQDIRGEGVDISLGVMGSGLSGTGELFRVMLPTPGEVTNMQIVARSTRNEDLEVLLAETSAPSLPQAFRLYQNSPNPFNPSTTIRFDLPQAGRATLEVFSADGRRVVSLLDGEVPAGAHQVVWDGHDGGGRAVASGTYFCRLKAGEHQQQGRMILIK